MTCKEEYKNFEQINLMVINQSRCCVDTAVCATENYIRNNQKEKNTSQQTKITHTEWSEETGVPGRLWCERVTLLCLPSTHFYCLSFCYSRSNGLVLYILCSTYTPRSRNGNEKNKKTELRLTEFLKLIAFTLYEALPGFRSVCECVSVYSVWNMTFYILLLRFFFGFGLFYSVGVFIFFILRLPFGNGSNMNKWMRVCYNNHSFCIL